MQLLKSIFILNLISFGRAKSLLNVDRWRSVPVTMATQSVMEDVTDQNGKIMGDFFDWQPIGLSVKM